jgi:transcriptional regulator with XRE-family HTH domain
VATGNNTGSRRPRAPYRYLSLPLRRLTPRLARALGAILRKYRVAGGLSQEAFAGILGIDRRTLATLELARSGTSLAMFVLLAHGFGVPPPVLLAEVMSLLENDPAERGGGRRPGP